MKKYIATIAFLLALTASVTSCREEKDVEVDTDGDIENTIEEGVNEVQENTGTGGTDDN